MTASSSIRSFFNKVCFYFSTCFNHLIERINVHTGDFLCHSDGSCKLSNGALVRTGYGELTGSDGTVYKGDWDADKMNGKGIPYI